MGAEVVEVVGNLPDDVVADHAARDRNGVGDTLRIGAAVALHHQAVQAEEDRAVVVVGVEMNLKQVERWLRKREACLLPQRALERAAQQIGDEARSALRRLQCDVAGEAVSHHNIDDPA